jgi:hypothetical protein
MPGRKVHDASNGSVCGTRRADEHANQGKLGSTEQAPLAHGCHPHHPETSDIPTAESPLPGYRSQHLQPICSCSARFPTHPLQNTSWTVGMVSVCSRHNGCGCHPVCTHNVCTSAMPCFSLLCNDPDHRSWGLLDLNLVYEPVDGFLSLGAFRKDCSCPTTPCWPTRLRTRSTRCSAVPSEVR